MSGRHMKTQDLITTLAQDVAAVDRASLQRRFFARAGAGLLLAFIGMMLVLGPRPDLRDAALLPMFWIKLGLPAAIGAAALLALRRVGAPGARLGWAPAAAAVPVLLVWLMALAALQGASPEQRLPLVMGSTWRECPTAITLLAIPAFVLAFRNLREWAPTRLRLAGATAGLFAGAAAALAYSLHCPELQAPFLAVWYVLGMLVPACIGAVIGPHFLRW